MLTTTSNFSPEQAQNNTPLPIPQNLGPFDTLVWCHKRVSRELPIDQASIATKVDKYFGFFRDNLRDLSIAYQESTKDGSIDSSRKLILLHKNCLEEARDCYRISKELLYYLKENHPDSPKTKETYSITRNFESLVDSHKYRQNEWNDDLFFEVKKYSLKTELNEHFLI